jgi:hypothetical protein
LVPNKRVTLQRRLEIKQRDGCAFFLRQTLKEDTDKDRTGSLRVVNPRYGFELRRATPSGAWVISNVTPDLSAGVPFSPPGEDVEIWSTCPINFALVYTTLRVIPTASGFSLKRITPEVRDGREWAKVEFEYRSQGNPKVPSITGWVLYDPDHYWVIRAFDLQLSWAGVEGGSGTMAAAYDYQDAGDGFPILKRIVRRFNLPEKAYGTDDTYEFDLREADVPESDFTLSAFGFPEPISAQRPTRWYLWATLAGGICLGLAALLRWRARRAARTPGRPQR